jgi:hypothetical protein
LSTATVDAATMRLHAAVVSVSSSSLLVTTSSGREVTVTLTPNLRILGVEKSSLESVVPGSYIGTTVIPQSDGTYKSTEVHIFAPSLRGSGEGFTKMNPEGSRMMANSTVREAPAEHMMANSTVRSVSGHAGAKTISMLFPSGRKIITIPPDVPVFQIDPGSKSLLTKGASVLLVTAPDGNPSSVRTILVGEHGTPLPL